VYQGTSAGAMIPNGRSSYKTERPWGEEMEIFKPKTEKRLRMPERNFILLCGILFFQIYQITNATYANYQLKKDPTLRIGEAAEDFCFYTARALIDGNYTWKMFDEVTYKGLKADSNYFNFMEDEVIKMVKVSGDQCRVLTMSNGRIKGLLITLNQSLKNPLYYKAIQINEEDDAKVASTNN
jgi:hypothetical protein